MLVLGLAVSTQNLAADLRLEVTNGGQLVTEGRLLVIFQRDNEEEPRFYERWPVADAPLLYGVDVDRWPVGEKRKVQDELLGFPLATVEEIPPGKWYVQALLDQNTIESDLNAQGNIYSAVQEVEIPEKGKVELALNLATVIPESKPEEPSDLVKYIKFRSDVLSAFWQRDVYLRAAVLLPNSYQTRINERFPVLFDIGGFHARYTRVEDLLAEKDFKAYWYSPEAPQAIVVFLDGEAPFGDSYQINSQSNGPYGDATWQELLPYLKQTFRMADDGKGLFTTGCSTGGWVSLALQIFHPDLFNGVWSYSADSVDFRAFQLINIYDDVNAYYSEFGPERPSARETDGEVMFTIKSEAEMENALGRGNSFVSGGGQWGAWMSVYGPRGSDGLPMALWDETGLINHELANAWRPMDLRLALESNWRNLGPKLAGKLNIFMGEMDDYYLNNAMVMFESMLAERTNPKSDAKFTWLPREGHCDMPKAERLQQTLAAAVARFKESNKAE